MNDITTTIELQEAIKQLEADYIVEERALKAQLHTTYEAIQPLNFIKSTLKLNRKSNRKQNDNTHTKDCRFFCNTWHNRGINTSSQRGKTGR